MLNLREFPKRFENDYKGWHGRNLYRRESEILRNFYYEEDVVDFEAEFIKARRGKSRRTRQQLMSITSSVLGDRSFNKKQTQLVEKRVPIIVINQARAQTQARQKRPKSINTDLFVPLDKDKLPSSNRGLASDFPFFNETSDADQSTRISSEPHSKEA
jgi:hypothetical protein